MIDDIQYWFEDHPMILPGIAVFFIMLLVVGSLAWLVAGAQTQVIVISNSSPTPEPTEIINASPTVEPVDNGSPASTVLPSYDDYLNWRDHYENKTTTGNPTTTPLLSGDPALSNGVRIYDRNATPTPTPRPAFNPVIENNVTPLRVEDTQLLPDSSMDSQMPGSLAWDPEHSTNLSYMYQGDHPVITMRFVSNCNYDIHKERVVLQLDRQDLFGGWWTVKSITWNDTAVITNGKDLAYGEATGEYVFYKNFSGIFPEGNIPDKWPIMGYKVDTSGRYRLQVWIYTPDSVGVESQACYISKQFQVLAKH